MKNELELVRISPKDRHFFFGYYDKHPWNQKQTKILGHEVFIEGRLPLKSDLADIGFFEQKNGTIGVHLIQGWRLTRAGSRQSNLVIGQGSKHS